MDPLNLELAVLIDNLTIELSPIDRFVFGRLCDAQIKRKFVTTRNPRSPLLPLESSTELMESISNSPSLGRRSESGASKRKARSCHVGLYVCLLLAIANISSSFKRWRAAVEFFSFFYVTDRNSTVRGQ